MEKEGNMVDDWLNEHADPETLKKIEMFSEEQDKLYQEYRIWFNEKFGCSPDEKHHGVGFTNLDEAISLRRDFSEDKKYAILTFEEYKNMLGYDK